MTIEHPRFPTPEDERRAAQLYRALREMADIDHDNPATGDKKPATATRPVETKKVSGRP